MATALACRSHAIDLITQSQRHRRLPDSRLGQALVSVRSLEKPPVDTRRTIGCGDLDVSRLPARRRRDELERDGDHIVGMIIVEAASEEQFRDAQCVGICLHFASDLLQGVGARDSSVFDMALAP
jgi:hypothetical protein